MRVRIDSDFNQLPKKPLPTPLEGAKRCHKQVRPIAVAQLRIRGPMNIGAWQKQWHMVMWLQVQITGNDDMDR